MSVYQPQNRCSHQSLEQGCVDSLLLTDSCIQPNLYCVWMQSGEVNDMSMYGDYGRHKLYTRKTCYFPRSSKVGIKLKY